MRNKDAKNFFEKPSVGSLKSRAIKGGGVSVAAEIISLVLRVFGVVVLARLLQPRDFGLVTMVTAFYLLLAGFGYNGFTEYIIQKETIDHAELSRIFWLHALCNLFLSLCFIASAPLMAIFYAEPEAKIIAIVMASGIMAQMLSTIHLSLLKRGMQFTKVAVVTTTARVTSVVLAILMAAKGFQYWSIVARQLSEVFIMAIGAWIACPWVPGVRVGLKKSLPSLRFALPVYGNYTLDYLARQLDKILLGRLHGSIVLGNYDRASYLASIPVDQLVAPLNNVGLATLSRLRNEPEKFHRYYVKALCLLAFVGVYGSLLLTLSGKDLVFLLLGPGWEQAGMVVSMLGPGTAAKIIYSTYSWLHLSLGKPQRWLRWNFIFLIFIAVVFAIVVRFGVVYLSLAVSITFYLLLVPAIQYAGKPIGLKMMPLIKSVGPYFAAGLGTCFIWLGLMMFCPPASTLVNALHPIIRLFLVIAFCTVAYLVLVVVFHLSTEPLKEFKSSLRMLVRREESNES